MNTLRPSHTAAITITITIKTQRERILLVELLHAEYANAHSTNGLRSLCVVIVLVLVMAAVGPGLKSHVVCTPHTQCASCIQLTLVITR